MKTPVEHIRLSKQARDQLMTLRKNTGIKHWNVLCRWAFCLSIAEPSKPTTIKQSGEVGVEITWPVFAGELSDTLLCLLKWRCQRDGVNDDVSSCSTYLRCHIQRGLGYLTADKRVRGIGSLADIACGTKVI